MDNVKTVKRNDGKSSIRTAFIFSCPGQEEEKSGRLVNGQTGKNLDLMLSFLKEDYPELFPSSDRYDYRITNSSEIVHYKAHDGRSEPKPQEISSDQNIERLKSDLDGYSCIIIFGRCAEIATELLKKKYGMENTIFLRSRHLSFLSLNSSIKTDVNGEPITKGDPDATKKRIRVAARFITDQLADYDSKL